jgi:hypothetical protein
MYRKNNAIATAGKTQQVKRTRIEGKYEAENIVKFPIGMNNACK